MNAHHIEPNGPADPPPIPRPELRESMRAIRDALPDEHRTHASEAAADHVARHFEYTRPRLVALFASFGSEIETRPLADKLIARGVELAYPIAKDRGQALEFRKARPDELVAGGPFGILQPAPSASTVAIADIDVFVVPGLAFDPYGARLGWGAGYYDQTLIHNPRAPRIGFGFAAQIRSRIPMETWDVPMTELASEKGVVPCRRRR